jgi:hypothetical protein
MIRRLTICAALAALFAAAPARAQFIGYVSPQTVTQTFSIACIGGNAPVLTPVQNLGQTNHLVVWNSNTPAVVAMNETGTSQGTFISAFGVGVFGSISAFGYYNVVNIVTSCVLNSTISMTYFGTSSSPGILTGQADVTSYDYYLGTGPANTGSNFGVSLTPPYGNTSGEILFQVTGTGAGSTGATILVEASGGAFGISQPTEYTFTPVTTNGVVQTFHIPPIQASMISVVYVPSGASTATYSLEYIFNKPGTANLVAGVPTHVTGTTATEAKAASGTLTKLVVNTSAAGTITIFDLGAAACTATPSTNILAVLTIPATESPDAIAYDAYFSNGLCVKASVAMDFTVMTQ